MGIMRRYDFVFVEAGCRVTNASLPHSLSTDSWFRFQSRSVLTCFLSNDAVKFIEEMYAFAPKLPRSGVNGSAKES
jgi:hypothetical protein